MADNSELIGMSGGTATLRTAVESCDQLDELRELVLSRLQTQKEQWAVKFNSILAESGYTKSKFSELCGVSRPTLDKWCNGAIPKSRETFLRIGMVAGYSINEMNRLLQRYGQYPGLYVKSLEDCICMYVINNYKGKDILQNYFYILNRIKGTLGDSVSAEEKSESNATAVLEDRLAEIESLAALEEFIRDNSFEFANAYRDLYAFITMFIKLNYIKDDLYMNFTRVADEQCWSSSLKQCVSAIRQKKWYPTRNKIISIGLHLSMDHEQVDDMLDMAHMEPLCAKNLFESIIIYILETAERDGLLDRDSLYYTPEELCVYAKETLQDFDMPEINTFLMELEMVDDL